MSQPIGTAERTKSNEVQQKAPNRVGHIPRECCKPFLGVVRKVRLAEAVARIGNGVGQGRDGVDDLFREWPACPELLREIVLHYLHNCISSDSSDLAGTCLW